MSKTPVPFAPETLETIQRAFRHASRRRHDTVGLEHLLLSITEEPTARQQLAACGADLPSLRQSVTDVLERAFVAVAGSASVLGCSRSCHGSICMPRPKPRRGAWCFSTTPTARFARAGFPP